MGCSVSDFGFVQLWRIRFYARKMVLFLCLWCQIPNKTTYFEQISGKSKSTPVSIQNLVAIPLVSSESSSTNQRVEQQINALSSSRRCGICCGPAIGNLIQRIDSMNQTGNTHRFKWPQNHANGAWKFSKSCSAETTNRFIVYNYQFTSGEHMLTWYISAGFLSKASSSVRRCGIVGGSATGFVFCLSITTNCQTTYRDWKPALTSR